MLQTGAEVSGGRAGGKVAVGILSRRQGNDARLQASTVQLSSEALRSLLASLIDVLVEGDIDATVRLVTKLRPLRQRKVSTDTAGGVAKSSLPEHG